MTPPTVVLIAAGAATRLGALTAGHPKILLEVAPGRTVLDCQLDALAEAGVKRAVIIVGFQARKIMAHVAGRQSGVDVAFVFNPFFRQSNNLASVWLGLQGLHGDVVTVNGDNVFTAAVLRRLIGATGDIVMTTSRKPGYDDDDMKVIVEPGGRVRAVGKQLDAAAATGESVGMFRYSEAGLARMRSMLTTMLMDDPGALSVFYLAAIQRLVDAGEAVHTIDIDADDWRELDFPEDLATIRSDIERGVLRGCPFSS